MSSPPQSLTLQLLGPFRILVDGTPIEERRFTRRKPKLLVKLLALQPHHQLHREEAMELLWPDADPDSATNNLNKAIHMARHALEPNLGSGADSHFILTQGQQLRLSAPGELRIDVDIFERLASQALRSNEIPAYEATLAIYSGDLLREDLYEDWITSRREQLRTRYQDLLLKLAGVLEAGGDHQQSIERYQQLLSEDASNEEVHRRLMHLLVTVGNKRQALRQYQLCCEALRRELDAKPEEATTRLYEQILSGDVPASSLTAPRTITPRTGVISSLAILPMASSSANPTVEYLGDGLTETLINSLSQLPQLRVIARTTVFRYKGKELDAAKVGRELGVDAVLTGEVIQRGDYLIIQVDLIDVADGAQVWGEQYKHQLADVLAVILTVQDQIAQQISDKLRLKLTGEEKKLLTKRHTVSSEAYEAYLKGRYYWNKRIEDGFRKAIDYFNQAIERDPGYAQAYAGLGDSYVLLSWYSVQAPKESFPQAKAAALKAIELDDTLAEAHTSLAFIKASYDWDWTGAEHEYQRAIALNPGYATARQWYAVFLSAMGRHDEAINEIERAQELDPLSLVINRDCGWVTYWARRYDEAIRHYFRTFELEPHFYIAHYFLGEVYEQKGDREKAIAEFHQTRTHPEWTTRVWTMLAHARAYALTGEREKAEEKIDELRSLSKEHYVSPYLIGAIYSQLRDKDQAFDWLKKALEERDPYLVHLNIEPALDPLRSDPRFVDLLTRIGLA